MPRFSVRQFVRAAALVPAAIALGGHARAQEVGGYAAAYLNRAEPARSSAMAGTFTAFDAEGNAVFGHPASLVNLSGPVGTASYTFMPYGQRLGMAGFAMPLDEAAGIGIGVVNYAVADVPAYSADGKRIGMVGASDLALSVGGGLRIGPGAVGATLRYLSFAPTGINAEGATGYSVDLSGMLEFENAFTGHDWLFASAAVANLAGEQRGPHRPAAANVRLSGSYLYPLEPERTLGTRRDPSGIASIRRLKPEWYVLGIVELRMAQYDPAPPTLGIAGEVSIPGTPVAVRLGWGTRTSITTGFAVRWPANVVIDVAGAIGGEVGDGNSGAATISYLF